MDAEDRLADIVGDWRERRDRGEYVDPEEVIRAHPSLAEALRVRFSALAAIDEMFSAARGHEPPLPERLGPYRIVRRLGAGGMGAVYLAEPEAGAAMESGQPVALKVLHSHVLGKAGFFKRFLREAQAGKQVRHENVVRTLDVDAGLLDGHQVCYLVLEYVEGRTLRELLADLRVVPEVLVREIAVQVAAGLEAIHAAGIVHRDVKPANVLITDDHRVRIMDLGVASVESETASLTREGEFVGSLAYAAPEQFRRGAVGPAADLYSLGVLLYELVTGENPFQRDEIGRVIAAHLDERPRPAAERGADVSEFFSEVLATLLAKEVGRRFASAAVLLEILRQAESSEWWAERETALRHGRPHLPRIPVQRETELHGRADDLATLHELWGRARAGDGNVVLVEGEAGIGKTRLVDAFLLDADLDDANVLYGSYAPSGGERALAAAVAERFGTRDLVNSLAAYLQPAPSLAPAFASLVAHEAPAPNVPGLGGDALHAVFCHLLRGLAAEKPTIWVVDDLHFASAGDRSVALSLARAIAGTRALLVLTARPSLPQGDVANLSRLPGFRRVPLQRLGARQVIELLRDAFRSEVLADKLGARVAFKSDGVPFFVFEMIRGLKDGQFVTELPDGTWVESRAIDRIEVPSAVRDLIEARLRDLGKEEREILDVAAVQGFVFDPDLVARVLERRRIHVLQDLAAIERRLGVVHGREGVCRFDHHQIQEVIYDDLMADLRREYHRLLADALLSRQQVAEHEPTDLPGDLASQLCDHYFRGGREEVGIRYLGAALDHLAGTYDHENAVALAERALAARDLLAGVARGRVLVRMAGLLDLQGRREDQRPLLEEAAALARDAGDGGLEADTLRTLGWHLYSVSRYEEAEDALRRAIALDEAAGRGVPRTAGRGSLGAVLMDTGRYEEARALLESSLSEAHSAGDHDVEMGITMHLANVLETLGEFELALELLQRRLRGAEESGDRVGESHAHQGLGNILYRMGRHEEARNEYEHALEIAREIGDRPAEAEAAGNLGNALLAQGLFEDARAHYERQLAIAPQVGSRRGEAIATGNVGLVLNAMGRTGEYLDSVERQLALCQQLGYRRGEAIGRLNEGSALVMLGDAEGGRAALDRAAAITREIKATWLEAYVTLARAGLAELQGDVAQANASYESALDQFRAREMSAEVASVLIERSRTSVACGEGASAVPWLDEAIDLARQTKRVDLEIEATALRAEITGDGAARAVDLLQSHEQRLGVRDLLHARWALWRATGDAADLAEAHRLLEHHRDHAPEEYRDSMIENVPLHRDIVAAWREHGASESETVVST